MESEIVREIELLDWIAHATSIVKQFLLWSGITWDQRYRWLGQYISIIEQKNQAIHQNNASNGQKILSSIKNAIHRPKNANDGLKKSKSSTKTSSGGPKNAKMQIIDLLLVSHL